MKSKQILECLRLQHFLVRKILLVFFVMGVSTYCGILSEDILGSGKNFLLWQDYRVVSQLKHFAPREFQLQRLLPALDVSKTQTVVELGHYPKLISGNLVLDAFFALTMNEISANSVENIQDVNFNFGRKISCPCFQTGKDWPYVWTRDMAYSIDLSLAFLQPNRSLQSLMFKVSDFRESMMSVAAGPVIVQDTGTGGSWPVSGDRLTWILAASKLLAVSDEGYSFLEKFIEISTNTVEQDRLASYNKDVGLYRGETSFLDWREQSYPLWTKEKAGEIAKSYAFSTNVLHFYALQTLAFLLEKEHTLDISMKYRSWAKDLADTILKKFWDPRQKLFYMVLLDDDSHLFPLKAYDLLGQILALKTGLVSKDQGLAVLSNYPLGPVGPSVLWPPRKEVPIYHNRAIWPFVTAYAYKEASRLLHSAFAERCFESLLGGLAMAFSHKENFEHTTLSPHFEDGPWSGPVINSDAQLWSIAGFASVFIEEIIGLKLTRKTIRVEPRIPAGILMRLFEDRDEILLENLHFKNQRISVRLLLPPAVREQAAAGKGWLVGGKVSLNGDDIAGEYYFREHHSQVLSFSVLLAYRADDGELAVRSWSRQESADLFAPKEPLISATRVNGHELLLALNRNGEEDTEFHIYRNGTLARKTTTNQSREALLDSGSTCFHIEQLSLQTGFISYPALPLCFAKSTFVGLSELSFTGSSPLFSYEHGEYHAANWGYPDQAASYTFTPLQSGHYALQLKYSNAFAPVSTGITASVKKVVVSAPQEERRFTGVVTMAQLSSWDEWALSTPLTIRAKENEPLHVTITDHYNMSYLKHYEAYTGGMGGHTGAINRINFAGLVLTLIHRDE